MENSRIIDELLNKAGQEYTNGHYAEALSLYEKAVTSDPDNAILHANISAILLKLNRPQDALEHAETALEISPHWAKAYYRAAEANIRLGNSTDAILLLSHAISIDTKNPQILNSLIDIANTCFETFPKAELENLGLLGSPFVILSTIGQLLLMRLQTIEGAKILQTALECESPSIKLKESTLASLGTAKHRLGEFRDAINYFEQQLEATKSLGGDTSEIHLHAARAAEKCGSYQLALFHIQKRIELLEEYFEGWPEEDYLIAASLMTKIKQWNGASEIFEKLSSSMIPAIAFRANFGVALVRNQQGFHAEALEILDELESLMNSANLQDAKTTRKSWRLSINASTLKRAFSKNFRKNSGEESDIAVDLQERASHKMNRFSMYDEIFDTTTLPLAIIELKNKCMVMEENTDQAVQFLTDKLKQLSPMDEAAQFSIHCLLSENHLILNLTHLAEKHIKKALKIVRKFGTETQIAKCLSILARIRKERGDESSYRTLTNHVMKMTACSAYMHISQCINDELKQLSMEFDFSYTIQEQIDMSVNIEQLESKRTEAQDCCDSENEAKCCLQLGHLLERCGRLHDAESMYTQLISIAKTEKNHIFLTLGFAQIVRLSKAQCQWENVAGYAKYVMSLCKTVEIPYLRTKMLQHLIIAETICSNWKSVDLLIEKFDTLIESANQKSDDVLQSAILCRFLVSVCEYAGKSMKGNYFLQQHAHMRDFLSDQLERSQCLLSFAALADANGSVEALQLVRNAMQSCIELEHSQKGWLWMRSAMICANFGCTNEALRIFEETLPLLEKDSFQINYYLRYLYSIPLYKIKQILAKLITKYSHILSTKQLLFVVARLAPDIPRNVQKTMESQLKFRQCTTTEYNAIKILCGDPEFDDFQNYNVCGEHIVKTSDIAQLLNVSEKIIDILCIVNKANANSYPNYKLIENVPDAYIHLVFDRLNAYENIPESIFDCSNLVARAHLQMARNLHELIDDDSALPLIDQLILVACDNDIVKYETMLSDYEAKFHLKLSISQWKDTYLLAVSFKETWIIARLFYVTLLLLHEGTPQKIHEFAIEHADEFVIINEHPFHLQVECGSLTYNLEFDDEENYSLFCSSEGFDTFYHDCLRKFCSNFIDNKFIQ